MRIRPCLLTIAVLGAVLAVSCGRSDQAGDDPLGRTGATPTRYTVRVVATHPHDDDAFTQGLVWAGDGELFESTGRRGESSLRRVDIESGDVLQRHDLAAEYFGEGLALADDRLIQLTWQEGTAFVYDTDSFEMTDSFEYEGEGWGLCFDGDRLVMSSGSSTLVFRDPQTFEPAGQVRVTLEGGSLGALNELECVGERIYANVLGDDQIYEIDPSTGAVTAVIDASSLADDRDARRGEILNGIAHVPGTRSFLLTGKEWPNLYEVTFEPAG